MTDNDQEILGVITSLRNGDLKPLAGFLKSGGNSEALADTVAVPWEIVDELIAMIEGEPWVWFRLDTKRRPQRRGTWTEELRREDQRFRIGVFTERRIRELGRGGYEAAVAEACAKFRIKSTKVTEAHKSVRQYLELREGFRVDPWSTLSARYSAD